MQRISQPFGFLQLQCLSYLSLQENIVSSGKMYLKKLLIDFM